MMRVWSGSNPRSFLQCSAAAIAGGVVLSSIPLEELPTAGCTSPWRGTPANHVTGWCSDARRKGAGMRRLRGKSGGAGPWRQWPSGLLVLVSPSGPSGAAAPHYENYVALGDSYTADVFTTFPPTTQYVPIGCGQSVTDYPHQLAKAAPRCALL